MIYELKKELYKDFIQKVNEYKPYTAHMESIQGSMKGKVLDVNAEHVVFLTDDQEQLAVEIEQIHFLHFLLP